MSAQVDQVWNVWWIKKDFRIEDNPALTSALESNLPVIALFVIEPSILQAPETSAFHVAAWIEAFRELRNQLLAAGGAAIAVCGEVLEVFTSVCSQVQVASIFSHQEIGTQRTFVRDQQVAAWADVNRIRWHEPMQTGVFRGKLNRDQRMTKWNQWVRLGPLPPPNSLQLQRLKLPDLHSVHLIDFGNHDDKHVLSSLGFQLNDPQWALRQEISTSAAKATLDSFLDERGSSYSGGISSPNTAFENGSRLSAHLAWGTLTVRQIIAALESRVAELRSSGVPNCGQWLKSLNAFRSRLNWRDHFIQRLESQPSLESHALNSAYEDLTFSNDRELLDAWCQGRTGFPLVDACIRCAQTTGFLNFRMRSMITSLACHALRLDWRDLRWPMARWWADFEPGIHLAQLQMQAGVVGINTLRTYNPAKQIADHDPNCTFIRRWIPELAKVPAEAILLHQRAPLIEYVAPIVNWSEATRAMRDEYYAIRKRPETNRLAEEVLRRHGSRKTPTNRRKPASQKTAQSALRSSKKGTHRSSQKNDNPQQLKLFDL